MDNCIFCKIVNGEIPDKEVYSDDKVIAILDLSPESDGHTLIIPKKHYTDFTELDSDILNHINEVAKKLTPILMDKMNATALTACYNYGDSQQVKHFHLHLIPNFRYSKPTMTQDEAYEILKDINL